MDIIVCPIFRDNVDNIICDVYLSNNTRPQKYSLDKLPAANNIYILLNSSHINIWDNIQLPPISPNKIKYALYSILEDNLLNQDNLFAYHKNSKTAIAVHEEFLAVIKSKISNNKGKIHILPLAKYFNTNEGIIQSYTNEQQNIINIYSYNHNNSYGLTLFNNHDNLNQIIPKLKIYQILPDYIWQNIKKYNFKELNLNYQYNQQKFSIKKYVPKWLFYTTISLLAAHLFIMQTLVIYKSRQANNEYKKLVSLFNKILPNQPMLDPIAQLNKAQNNKKNDNALEELDKLQPFLSKYSKDIKEIFFLNNIWNIKFNSLNNNLMSKLNIDAQNMSIVLEEENDIWQIRSNN